MGRDAFPYPRALQALSSLALLTDVIALEAKLGWFLSRELSFPQEVEGMLMSVC